LAREILGKTDHGTKCEELVTLMDELLEQPDIKIVIFSQWRRTYKLIIRRLKSKRWQHVLFHGGVPSGQGGALVDRLHSDPACRVFLSTDAGGVGLNLQHAASVVVNMDLPWNLAVLEQRIGRVHRLGPTRGVQVVNFVAEGTIEEGMLSVLAFKKSLFAGVPDGGGTGSVSRRMTVEEVYGGRRGCDSCVPADRLGDHIANRRDAGGDRPRAAQRCHFGIGFSLDSRGSSEAIPT
jgi:SNF2 family DNA or RNA helicase